MMEPVCNAFRTWRDFGRHMLAWQLFRLSVDIARIAEDLVPARRH